MKINECTWNVKTAFGQKLMTAEILRKTPSIYGTEGVTDKVLTAHFFVGNFDAYLVELDPVTGEAFGYVGFNNEFELGYFSIPELAKSSIKGFPVERDRYFERCNASKILCA